MACGNTTLNEVGAAHCQVVHPSKQLYSLTALRLPQDLEVTKNGSKFFLQPCGPTTHCSGSICWKNPVGGAFISLGNMTSSTFDMESKELHVHYASEAECTDKATPGAKRSAEIWFACNPDARTPKITLVLDMFCHTIFHWETYQVCSAFDSEPDPQVVPEGTQPRASHALAAFVIMVLFATLVSVIVFRKPQNRERIQEFLRTLRENICRRQDQPDRQILVSNVHIPTFGGLEVNEDDDDLILA